MSMASKAPEYVQQVSMLSKEPYSECSNIMLDDAVFLSKREYVLGVFIDDPFHPRPNLRSKSFNTPITLAASTSIGARPG